MKHSRHLALILACTGLLAASPYAAAHSDDYLDTVQAPHGGQIRMAGGLHLELVLDKAGSDVKPRPIVVHVSDHGGQAQKTAGATGTVTLLMGKDKVTAALKPEGENRLAGTASYAAVPGIKAIVSVTLKGQEPQQARFTPVAASSSTSPAPDGHAGHKH